jgi:phosphoglucosamine mutase
MRKLFETDGIRGMANVYPITPEMALQMGKAIAYTIKNEKKPKIVIGKDTRLSGYMIESALVSGIVSMGVDAYLLGPLPTPAVALLTKSLSAQIGVVITASHNPAIDNGIKLFDRDGFKLPDEKEEEIEKLIFSDKTDEEEMKDIVGDKIGKAYRVDEARGRYIEFTKSSITDFKLDGLKIVLDCANGAAYYVAPRIFSELGAEVITINDKPNGININLDCGAIHPENAADVVKKEKADIGIILDGDADRLIVCDEHGEVIDGDYLLVFCAIDMIKKGKLNKNTLVVTEYSNVGVDEAMRNNKGNVVRTKNGDRYVIEEMRKNDYGLGGEFSGHIIFKDFTTTGDGIVSALQFLKLLKEKNIKASEVRKVMRKYPLVLLNINVNQKIPLETIPLVKNKIEEVTKKLTGEGRLLIRYSGTQNVCRVMIEGKKQEEIGIMANEIADLIRKNIGA